MNRFLVQSSRLLLLCNQLGASKNLSCTRELKQNTIVLESDDFRVETRDGPVPQNDCKKKRADGKDNGDNANMGDGNTSVDKKMSMKNDDETVPSTPLVSASTQKIMRRQQQKQCSTGAETSHQSARRQ